MSDSERLRQETDDELSLRTRTVRIFPEIDASNYVPPDLSDFEIFEQIGRGGMGVVYRAIQKSLNRQIALKLLPPSSQFDSASRQRFLLEARAVAKLNHDHIVPVYQIGSEDEKYFYAMKLIDGENLATVIKSARTTLKLGDSSTKAGISSAKEAETVSEAFGSGRLSLSGADFAQSQQYSGTRSAKRIASSVATIGLQAASALQHAHENGVVHRDIKPSNLLLDKDDRVWLTDFGLARLNEATGVTRTGEVVGTLKYMSPEQASGRRAFVDHRTDIYSLGVTIYELATLQTACRGKNMREILHELTFDRPTPIRKLNPRLPYDFETIVCKAIERNPSDRYQTAAEMMDDLNRFIRGEPPRARRSSRLKRAFDWCYEHPVYTSVLSTGVLFLLALMTLTAVLLGKGLASQAAIAEELVGRNEILDGQKSIESAMYTVETNPGRAIGFAVDGLEKAPGTYGNFALASVLDPNHELKTVLGIEATAGKIVFSPDGGRLVLCNHPQFYSNGLTDAVCLDLKEGDPADAEFLSISRAGTLPSDSPITNATFDQTGRFILTGSSNDMDVSASDSLDQIKFGSVSLWDARSWRQERVIQGCQLLNTSVQSFAENPLRVAVPRRDGAAQIFEVDPWRECLMIRDESPVRLASFSPRASYLVTTHDNGDTVVRSPNDGKVLHRFPNESKCTLKLQFSDGEQILLVVKPRNSRLYDLSVGKEIFRSKTGIALLRRSGDRLYCQVSQSTIDVVSIPDAEVMGECSVEGAIADFMLASEESTIVARVRNSCWLFDAQTCELLGRCDGHGELVKNITARPYSDQFGSVSLDGTFRLWSVSSDVQRRTFPVQMERHGPLHFHYSKNGEQAVASTVSQVQTIALEPGDPDQLRTIPSKLESILSDGRLVASDGPILQLWDPGATSVQNSISIDEPIESVWEQSKGDELLLKFRSGTLKKWNPKRNHLANLKSFQGKARFVAVDSNLAVAYLIDEQARLFSLDLANDDLAELMMLDEYPVDLSLAKNGKRLLIAFKGGEILLHSIDPSETAGRISTGDTIQHAHLVLDGNYALVFLGENSRETTLKLWDLQNETSTDPVDLGTVYDFAINEKRNCVAIATRTSGAIAWELEAEPWKITTTPTGTIAFAGGKVFATTEPSRSVAGNGPAELSTPRLLTASLIDRSVKTVCSLPFSAVKSRYSGASSRLLLSGRTYGAVVVETSEASVKQRVMGHQSVLVATGFTDNDRLVTVPEIGPIYVHELRQGAKKIVGHPKHKITGALLANNGEFLFTADNQGTLQEWKIRGNSQPQSLQNVGASPIEQMALSASGRVLFGLNSDGELKTWDVGSREENSIDTDGDAVRSFAVSPSGNQLVTVTRFTRSYPSVGIPAQFQRSAPGTKRSAFVHDIDSRRIRELHTAYPLISASFTHDGKTIVLLDATGSVESLDAESLEPVKKHVMPGTVLSVGPLRQRPSAFQCCLENGIAIVDARSGELKCRIEFRRRDRRDAFGRLQNWELLGPQRKSFLCYRNGSFFYQPVDILGYAKRMAPALPEDHASLPDDSATASSP
ncbi:MAG: hypothetical protein Aurels2KO_39010 [Aureliella sp.]